MTKIIICFLFCFSILSSGYCQDWKARMDSIRELNHADHKLMMSELGITALRPGPSGSPQAENAANSDESKASPYKKLPDPLVFNNGIKVQTSEQWEKRRLEILEDFDREIYGRIPKDIPSVRWAVVVEKDTTIGNFPAHMKELIGYVDNSSYPSVDVNIRLKLVTPAHSTNPVPVMMEFGFNFPGMKKWEETDGPSWKQQLLSKGWGYAILIPTSFQADNGAGLREGIIGLVNKGMPRNLEDWGTLRAWAWGAGRAMDYFETDPEVDQYRIGIEGLSRYGKAAIVTMAYDIRFAIGFIGSSGAGGIKILRRFFGEQVENLASADEYHWFTPNFLKYAGPLTSNDLPVDAHELVALCAPRPVFISCGAPSVEGTWVDDKGMFLGGVYAGSVYRLLGKKGLEAKEFPPMGKALVNGDIGFRQHFGGHTVTPNWPIFIEFAEKYFKK